MDDDGVGGRAASRTCSRELTAWPLHWAAAGAGGSSFGDWWAYKVEAYDAIPQNAAEMDAAGVLSSLNSDSAEMMRRL